MLTNIFDGTKKPYKQEKPSQKLKTNITDKQKTKYKKWKIYE